MKDATPCGSLEISLGNASTEATAGSLPGVGPEEARACSTPPEWVVGVDSQGYLYDPEWTDEDWPTWREHWAYDCLSVAEKIEHLLIQAIGDDEAEWKERHGIVMPPDGWRAADLEKVEELFGDILEEPVDSEYLGSLTSLQEGSYAVGLHLLDALPADLSERIGLFLEEGQCPGNDFCAVKFIGQLDVLNTALRLHGLDVEVRRNI